MIRYRPMRYTTTASIKDEELFDNVEEMLSAIFDHWSKIMAFIGEENTLQPEKIFIDKTGKSNPTVGYHDEHQILLHREKDLCIGYCDLEECI